MELLQQSHIQRPLISSLGSGGLLQHLSNNGWTMIVTDSLASGESLWTTSYRTSRDYGTEQLVERAESASQSCTPSCMARLSQLHPVFLRLWTDKVVQFRSPISLHYATLTALAKAVYSHLASISIFANIMLESDGMSICTVELLPGMGYLFVYEHATLASKIRLSSTWLSQQGCNTYLLLSICLSSLASCNVMEQLFATSPQSS